MQKKTIMGLQFNKQVKVYLLSHMTTVLPLYGGISAGFPSPADDYIEEQLNLDDLLIKNPSATFFIKVDGDSMIGAGIHSGDILIVDRSLEAHHNKVIVAIIDGEFTVKRLVKRQSVYYLEAANPRYAPIPISKHSDFLVWGVVTQVIHDPSL